MMINCESATASHLMYNNRFKHAVLAEAVRDQNE